MCFEPFETSLTCPPSPYFHVLANFLFHSREHPVHHVHGARIQPRLHMCHSVVPMTFSGIFDFHARSRAARGKKRFRRNPQPRRNHPPRYSPSLKSHQNRNRRPKSTTIHGPPLFVNAATPFTMRSAPTSMGYPQHRHPRFHSEFDEQRLLSKINTRHFSSVQFTGGTTELIITPVIASRSSPQRKKVPCQHAIFITVARAPSSIANWQ